MSGFYAESSGHSASRIDAELHEIRPDREGRRHQAVEQPVVSQAEPIRREGTRPTTLGDDTGFSAAWAIAAQAQSRSSNRFRVRRGHHPNIEKAGQIFRADSLASARFRRPLQLAPYGNDGVRLGYLFG